jgi:hypothetical protein
MIRIVWKKQLHRRHTMASGVACHHHGCIFILDLCQGTYLIIGGRWHAGTGGLRQRLELLQGMVARVRQAQPMGEKWQSVR